MTVDISRVLSVISLAIVLAPPEVQAPGPIGRATAVKRYKEGLTNAQSLRAELLLLGYSQSQADQSLTQADLERDYDTWSDRIAALKAAYLDGRVPDEQLLALLLELVPDAVKSQALADLWLELKLPKVAAPKAAAIPTLSVAQLLAAYTAGVLTAAALAAELAERQYSPEDAALLVDTATARLPRPTQAEAAAIPLADLRALLALGKVTAAAFRAELVRRKYAPADADLMLGLEQARIAARIAPPDLKMLPLADLKALYALDQIGEAVFRTELARQQFSAAAIEQEVALANVRKLPRPAPVHELTEAQLSALYILGEITALDLRDELIARNYSPQAADGVLAIARSRLAAAGLP